MNERPIQDLNDGKPWSEMDLFAKEDVLTVSRALKLPRRSKGGKADSLGVAVVEAALSTLPEFGTCKVRGKEVFGSFIEVLPHWTKS
jgi:hypothetical protein